MDFIAGLHKIVTALETENIGYMIVGGFAMSYYNRFRYTADIDCLVQIYAHHVDKILKYFPDWQHSSNEYKQSVEAGMLFNITDFETGVRYDFMPYQDSDYNWTAFERRKRVHFLGCDCYISSAEDLIIAKLKWHAISPSEKQLDDAKFLLENVDLNLNYLKNWTQKLYIKTHGLY